MSYKDLFTMLKKPGTQSIEMPSKDMIPFLKYITKAKYKDKVYTRVENGKVKFSKQPLK